MAEPHPCELRERVARAYEAGEGSYEEVSVRFSIGSASVKRWVRLLRNAGSVEPQPKGGGTPSPIMGTEIETLVKQLGDPTARELTAAYNKARRGKARTHVSSMKRALHRHGYVVKKNAAGRWSVYAPTSSKNAKRT